MRVAVRPPPARRADYEYMYKNDPVTGKVGFMSATNLMSSGGRTGGRVKHYYPVDFFMYESRGALDFVSEAFAAHWPHPAVVAKQYAHYAGPGARHNGYRHGAELLRHVREKLQVAQKLDPREVNGLSPLHTRI